ncbi:MAG: hypothetical protein IJ111_11535 [Eggerthellaceae bacterium]|nr:hypothetical protein [Eggerthellaceae bacterium]
MSGVEKPDGNVALLFTYDVDCDNHVVYCVGADETGNHCSVEERESNIVQRVPFTGITTLLRIPRLKI